MEGRRVGIPVDAVVERRLACIGQMTREFEHAPLRGLFEREVQGIAARYRVGEFDTRNALSLVESFDEIPLLKEGSGASLQRELLNSILANEKAWWADDLSRLIEFAKGSPIWSKDDEDTLDRKIRQYEKEIDYEYDSCASTGDYERFREELEALGECLGEPFTKVIQRIDAHLAETAPPDDPEHKHSGSSWRGASGIKDWMADTDTAIRDVFSSLVD